MTADTLRDQIAEAVAVHWFTVNSEALTDPGSRRAWISCRCGWFGNNLDPDTVPEREREKGRHLADAVLPILRAALAQQAEDAAQVAVEAREHSDPPYAEQVRAAERERIAQAIEAQRGQTYNNVGFEALTHAARIARAGGGPS